MRNKLKPIPENKIGAYMNSFIEKIEKGEKSTSVCPECGNKIETFDMPYGYDPEENDVYFVSVCPACGAILYSKE